MNLLFPTPDFPLSSLEMFYFSILPTVCLNLRDYYILSQAADDRPSRTGEPLDQECGERQQTARHKTDRSGLHANAGELRHVRKPAAAGKHRRGARLFAGTTAASTDI